MALTYEQEYAHQQVKQGILDIAIKDRALIRNLTWANDKSDQTIKGWLRKNYKLLCLPHNLKLLAEYTNSRGEVITEPRQVIIKRK